MSGENFVPGDTVILRSGGPDMTVEKVANDMEGKPIVWCTWFVSLKRESGGFVPATLQKT